MFRYKPLEKTKFRIYISTKLPNRISKIVKNLCLELKYKLIKCPTNYFLLIISFIKLRNLYNKRSLISVSVSCEGLRALSCLIFIIRVRVSNWVVAQLLRRYNAKAVISLIWVNDLNLFEFVANQRSGNIRTTWLNESSSTFSRTLTPGEDMCGNAIDVLHDFVHTLGVLAVAGIGEVLADLSTEQRN